MQVADLSAIKLGYHQLNQQLFFGQMLDNQFAIVISALALLAFWYIVLEQKLPTTIATLFSAAVASNIVDRLYRGGVVDYFEIWWIPRFNLADSAICLIIAWSIYLIWQISIKKHQEVS